MKILNKLLKLIQSCESEIDYLVVTLVSNFFPRFSTTV